MMGIAYLDCGSGVSGDMMLGALVDAGADLAAMEAGVRSAGLDACRLVAEDVRRCGFRALKVRVVHPPEHVHRHLGDILAMIDGSRLTAAQKDLARRIFQRLGEAEARVHGQPIDQVHFHEVGAADSIADIVGAAVGWDLLGAERLICSPIPTGAGRVRIAHGEVSVPAPATAELLRGVPLAPSNMPVELTTPTGAAIVTTLAAQFGSPPAMTVQRIGYGAGDRDLPQQPNVLRLLVGTAWAEVESGQIWVLETNLDDCPGEWIGHCLERLMQAGALDAYAAPIQMKKNRPGVLLSVLCRAGDAPALEQIVFEETTTLGVRRWPASRHTLVRRRRTVQTPYGPIDGKLAEGPAGSRFSPEYEACRQAAQRTGRPLREIYEAARQAFASGRETDRTADP